MRTVLVAFMVATDDQQLANAEVELRLDAADLLVTDDGKSAPDLIRTYAVIDTDTILRDSL